MRGCELRLFTGQGISIYYYFLHLGVTHSSSYHFLLVKALFLDFAALCFRYNPLLQYSFSQVDDLCTLL